MMTLRASKRHGLVVSASAPRIDLAEPNVPAFFCRTESPEIPLVQPWMDLDTGDSFEHTERALHPHAMQNIQLQSAYAAFVEARKRKLTQAEVLATLSRHARCPLTCDGMTQPVRAPDNMLYEAVPLLKSLHTWKAASPLTREVFPTRFTLTVDRRMQRLSEACGTPVADPQRKLLHLPVRVPQFATSPSAMEEGRRDAASQTDSEFDRVYYLSRVAVGVCQGVVTGLLLHAMGVPLPISGVLGSLFSAGSVLIPSRMAERMWGTSPGFTEIT